MPLYVKLKDGTHFQKIVRWLKRTQTDIISELLIFIAT